MAPAPDTPTADTYPTAAAQTPSATVDHPAHPDAPVERPAGVTVLGVLYALGTGLLFLAALALIVGGGVFAAIILNAVPGLGGQLGLGGILFVFLGLFVAVLGVLVLLVTIGLFKGLAWAWTTVLVIEAITAVGQLLSLFDGETSALFGLAIAGLIVWYLFEPAPKAFFGKAHVKAFWQKEKQKPRIE